MERRIGKIRGTFLGVEDHGILTATLTMDFGGSGMTIGGYECDEHVARDKPRRGLPQGMTFVRRVLEACGVRSWEALTGRTVYVLMDDQRPVGIEPLPTELGKVFLFAEVYEAGGGAL